MSQWRPAAKEGELTVNRFPKFADLGILNSFTAPLRAVSQTRNRYEQEDLIIGPAVRSLIYMTLFPPLAYPLALTHAIGYVNCLLTMMGPNAFERKPLISNDLRVFAISKRWYDPTMKRVRESVIQDINEMKHALTVVGTIRNEYVDDPATVVVPAHVDSHDVKKPFSRLGPSLPTTTSATSYFVQEKGVGSPITFATMSDGWGWCMTADVIRYVTPIVLAASFHAPSVRLLTDVGQWWTGRLAFRSIRHPIRHFFMSARQYQKAKQRINVTLAPKRGTRPWHVGKF